MKIKDSFRIFKSLYLVFSHLYFCVIYFAGQSSYCIVFLLDAASKHAVQAFCDSLRAEVAKDNIHVTVVNPGYIRTNLSRNALSGDGSKHGGKYHIQLLANFTMTTYLLRVDFEDLIHC